MVLNPGLQLLGRCQSGECSDTHMEHMHEQRLSRFKLTKHPGSKDNRV
jgi:hypothetical protein